MSKLKNKKGEWLGDPGWVAEELMKGSNNRRQKCLVAYRTIQDGDFTYEEAKDVYEFSDEEYKIYILMNKEYILVGKTLSEASELLRNYVWRIAEQDEIKYEYGRDINTNRYNLYIKNGFVTKVILI